MLVDESNNYQVDEALVNDSDSEPCNRLVDGRTNRADRCLAKLEAQIAEIDRRVDEAMQSDDSLKVAQPPSKPDHVTIWGVPFSKLTLADTLRHIDQLIAWGQPGYFITANLNYNMLTRQHPDLAEVNENAAFIVCDGMPMVWWSRWRREPLPERVAGSEMIYALTKWAATKAYRVFFLGGAAGVAQAAADNLAQRYAGLQVAGVESPPFRPLTESEEADLIRRVRDTRPDIVYVALGQPKGERWISQYADAIGAPVCVQIGASFDFVAGGVPRAPRLLQRAGLEWAFRMAQEPGRLTGRYTRNALFLLRAVCKETIFGPR